MAKMKKRDLNKELNAKGDAELQRDLTSLREKIRDFRFRRFAGEVKDTSEHSVMRKTAARIHGILTSRKTVAKESK